MAKRKSTNNDLRNITQKTKHPVYCILYNIMVLLLNNLCNKDFYFLLQIFSFQHKALRRGTSYFQKGTNNNVCFSNTNMYILSVIVSAQNACSFQKQFLRIDKFFCPIIKWHTAISQHVHCVFDFKYSKSISSFASNIPRVNVLQLHSLFSSLEPLLPSNNWLSTITIKVMNTVGIIIITAVKYSFDVEDEFIFSWLQVWSRIKFIKN